MALQNEAKFVPIETQLKKMTVLEQYVAKVVNYTSRFNNSNSYYYAPINIIGKYTKYPSYGDFPETYILRSYGKWWKLSEAYQSEYMPQDVDPLGAEDYITLEFEDAVIPRDVCIYEIYNPGAIVRIWGKRIHDKNKWIRLWEGPAEPYPDKSRKFHPKIRNVNFMIKTIRLEFNQSNLRYHTSVDAVLLGGYQPQSLLQYKIISQDWIDNVAKVGSNNALNDVCDISDNYDLFSTLPVEVIVHIFQYLDLKSLSNCAKVNKRWYEATLDPVLYQNLSLKRYWHIVNCDTLEYFMDKCRGLKKLDISWCGNEDEGFYEKFRLFLSKCCKNLTHLSMGNCNFVNNDMITSISFCKELVDLRLKNTVFWRFSTLDKLTKLVSLDFTSSHIQDNDLIRILKANPNLKHIIIDLCEKLTRLDQIVEAAVQFNKNLTTWSSWKTLSLTSDGVGLFRHFTNLKELDLGWCLINIDPGDGLERIASGCRNLQRLIISEWRGLNDQLLSPIIRSCKELTQLDVVGIKYVTGDVCEKALVGLPKLRLLDISFCDSIKNEQVEIWRQQYPHITIQRSCQYVVTDYLN